MVGKSEAAFYSVAYTISTMMMLIVTSVNNSLTPFIYKSIESGEVKNLKKVTAPIIFLMALLCLLTVIFAPEVIYIFAGKKYMDAIYVIPPVAISVFFVFLYSLYSTIEYYYQQTGYIALATTLSAVLNLVLNFILSSFFKFNINPSDVLFPFHLLIIIFIRKLLEKNYIRIQSLMIA